MHDDHLTARAGALVRAYAARGWMVVTAESCTGGLVAALLTEIAGSSAVVDRAFVTYSNEAKAEAIGVDPGLIATHGAVSREVACAMATGALAASRATVAVAITGIAGPGGGSDAKPVGLVHLARASRMEAEPVAIERRYGDVGRSQVRALAVADALGLMEALLA